MLCEVTISPLQDAHYRFGFFPNRMGSECVGWWIIKSENHPKDWRAWGETGIEVGDLVIATLDTEPNFEFNLPNFKRNFPKRIGSMKYMYYIFSPIPEDERDKPENEQAETGGEQVEA